jgi:hypothetical protein
MYAKMTITTTVTPTKTHIIHSPSTYGLVSNQRMTKMEASGPRKTPNAKTRQPSAFRMITHRVRSRRNDSARFSGSQGIVQDIARGESVVRPSYSNTDVATAAAAASRKPIPSVICMAFRALYRVANMSDEVLPCRSVVTILADYIVAFASVLSPRPQRSRLKVYQPIPVMMPSPKYITAKAVQNRVLSMDGIVQTMSATGKRTNTISANDAECEKRS